MSVLSPRRRSRSSTPTRPASSGRRASRRRAAFQPRLLDTLLEDRTLLAFTLPSLPTAAYVAGTHLIPITGADNVSILSISDGTETVSFSSNMRTQTVPGGGWNNWGSPPETESATPRVLYSLGA